MEGLASNPLFRSYAACVTALSLKMSFTAWTTVVLMLSGLKGMRNPEDTRKTISNPNPSPDQIKPWEPTEKQRRIMGHDIENNLPFFAVGLTYVILDAGDANVLYVYTASKFLHHAAYWAAADHEVRATLWTVTNASFLWMSKLVIDKLL